MAVLLLTCPLSRQYLSRGSSFSFFRFIGSGLIRQYRTVPAHEVPFAPFMDSVGSSLSHPDSAPPVSSAGPLLSPTFVGTQSEPSLLAEAPATPREGTLRASSTDSDEHGRFQSASAPATSREGTLRASPTVRLDDPALFGFSSSSLDRAPVSIHGSGFGPLSDPGSRPNVPSGFRPNVPN